MRKPPALDVLSDMSFRVKVTVILQMGFRALCMHMALYLWARVYGISIAKPPQGVDKGYWGAGAACPDGNVFARLHVVAATASLQRANAKDNSALNSVSLRCDDGAEIQSVEGPDGHWGQLIELISPHFATLMALVLSAWSSDLMYCSRCLPRGAWSDWVECPAGEYIYGARIKSEALQTSGDNLALCFADVIVSNFLVPLVFGAVSSLGALLLTRTASCLQSKN
eukprot:1380878-Amphidinium_carterae.1